MADIVQFAMQREEGVVFCAHGKHRSVSVGSILQILFHRHVNFESCYPREACEHCNDLVSEHRVEEIARVLRSLPGDKEGQLLADALHLRRFDEGVHHVALLYILGRQVRPCAEARRKF